MAENSPKKGNRYTGTESIKSPNKINPKRPTQDIS